jgi:hypothetical protein
LISLEQKEPGKKVKYQELSVNTVAFISYRCRLTKVLAGAARGKKGILLLVKHKLLDAAPDHVRRQFEMA